MKDQFDVLMRQCALLFPQAQLTLSDDADGARLAEWVLADRRLLAVLERERPEHLSLFCDVGEVDESSIGSVGLLLLQANLFLIDHNLGGWGIDPSSKHLVYVTGGHVATTTPTQLFDVIRRLCEEAAHWHSVLQTTAMPPMAPPPMGVSAA